MTLFTISIDTSPKNNKTNFSLEKEILFYNYHQTIFSEKY